MDHSRARIPHVAIVGEAAGDVGCAHRAFVAQCHLHEQCLGQVAAMPHPAGNQRRGLEVEHDDVGLHAGRNAADAVIEIERVRATACREVERLRRGERLTVELRDFVCLMHRGEHRKTRPAADVGGERDAHAARRPARFVQLEETAAEEGIRSGTVRDRGAGFVAAANSLSLSQIAVAVDRARAERAMVVVDIEIAGTVGKELLDPRDFAAVFRDMRLQVRARMLAPQGARRVELRGRARSRETRRHAIEQPAAAMPALQRGLAVVVARIAPYRATRPGHCDP